MIVVVYTQNYTNLINTLWENNTNLMIINADGNISPTGHISVKRDYK